MNTDFLSLVDGLKSENLVSEVLAYILRDRRYKPLQRLFYNYLFENNSNMSTNEFNLIIDTRLKYEYYGVPDIVITNNKDTVVFIENKFYAPYSGPDQLSRYYRLAIEHKDFRNLQNKVLAILTTVGRAGHYLHEAISDFSQFDKNIDRKRSLIDFLQKSNVQFKILTWQAVIRLFESEDIIINSLSQYINRNFIGEVAFMENEIRALESDKYPIAFDKMLKTIDVIRERMDSIGFDTKTYKMSQSINYYGFTMKLSNCSVWFGYFRQLWHRSKPCTPLYMQFRMDWITEKNFEESLIKEKLLGALQFDETHEFIKAYEIRKLNNLDSFVEDLSNNVVNIEKIVELGLTK